MRGAPRRLRWLSEHFVPRRRARVLEVGCGNGQLLALLAHRHPHLTLVGIDRSALQVRQARRRLAELPAPPPVYAVALEEAAGRLQGAPFTHIVAMNVNLAWTDPRAAGSALRALLAPRGTVVLGFEPPTPNGRTGLRARLARAATTAGFTEHAEYDDADSTTFVVEWRLRPRARTGTA